MGKMRLLNQKEQELLRPIERDYGLRFDGGSCETHDDGKTTYRVGFKGIMATLGNTIGPRVKKALGADMLILNYPGDSKIV